MSTFSVGARLIRLLKFHGPIWFDLLMIMEFYTLEFSYIVTTVIKNMLSIKIFMGNIYI